MQGGKGKVERRLISFSLSGVTSLGRVRERHLLTPTPSTTSPSLQARLQTAPRVPHGSSGTNHLPPNTQGHLVFPRREHGWRCMTLRPHLFAMYKLWEL